MQKTLATATNSCDMRPSNRRRYKTFDVSMLGCQNAMQDAILNT